MIEDIWKQPAKGFTEESKGRTEEQIIQKETEIGFKFPILYREYMKMQNGGYIWKSALNYNGEVNELLYNGSTIDPIVNHGGYKTLKEVLLEYMDKEELESSSDSEFLDLNRLSASLFRQTPSSDQYNKLRQVDGAKDALPSA